MTTIYELIGLKLTKHSPQEVKLQHYLKGHEAFASRKFEDAKEEFRRFTKIYGYDSAVERLQVLVGERKTMDDRYVTDESHYTDDDGLYYT